MEEEVLMDGENQTSYALRIKKIETFFQYAREGSLS